MIVGTEISARRHRIARIGRRRRLGEADLQRRLRKQLHGRWVKLKSAFEPDTLRLGERGRAVAGCHWEAFDAAYQPQALRRVRATQRNIFQVRVFDGADFLLEEVQVNELNLWTGDRRAARWVIRLNPIWLVKVAVGKGLLARIGGGENGALPAHVHRAGTDEEIERMRCGRNQRRGRNPQARVRRTGNPRDTDGKAVIGRAARADDVQRIGFNCSAEGFLEGIEIAIKDDPALLHDGAFVT